MKTKFTVLSLLIIPLLLLGIVGEGVAQNIDLSKTVANVTKASNGNVAEQGNILQYTIVVNNIYYYNFTNARLYDNIPAGTSYIAGSTTMNNAAVADVSGNMPFSGTGGLIKSGPAALGTLMPGFPATIRFKVKVTANGGNVTNYAMLDYTNAGTVQTQNTNTVFTNLTPDPQCSIIYQSTASSRSGTPSSGDRYRYIRTMNTNNGQAGPILYDGATGPCTEAMGSQAALANGSVFTYSSAIAYDKTSNRIYFVNNLSGNGDHDLSYIDLNASPVKARRFTGYPLNNGTAINRMAFASDGFGYAVTSNGDELVRFSVNALTNTPTITSLGGLLDDANNGNKSILSEGGGDLFGDGSGNLYLIANSSRLYKINPNTRRSTWLGDVYPSPGGSSNSLAIDAAGNVYVGGAYQNVYTVDLSTMVSTSITGGSTSNVYTNGDYASCGFPVLAPALVANKTWSNINGLPEVVGGDTVEYRIEVINTGNLNAAGVKLYDYIPSGTAYVPNTTKLNGANYPDLAGNVMAFSVAGGQQISTLGQTNGIIKPGNAFKVIMTFRVRVQPDAFVCNQSRVTLYDMNNNVIFVNSTDPTQSDGSGSGSTCFYSFGVLPDDNLAFKVSLLDAQSLTQWSIKNEYNISHFEVEYSPDGQNFTYAGKVLSKGNIQGINNYQFIDPSNTAATNRYYRLKIFSTRGSFTYSSVLRISTGSLTVSHVQPNPFDKVLSLQLYMKNADKVDIRLIDMYGRIVYHSNQQFGKGAHTFTLNVPRGLAKGSYVLQMKAGAEQLFQQKLIKQ